MQTWQIIKGVLINNINFVECWVHILIYDNYLSLSIICLILWVSADMSALSCSINVRRSKLLFVHVIFCFKYNHSQLNISKLTNAGWLCIIPRSNIPPFLYTPQTQVPTIYIQQHNGMLPCCLQNGYHDWKVLPYEVKALDLATHDLDMKHDEMIEQQYHSLILMFYLMACVVFCRSLFVLLYFLRLACLITPLVSPNCSYIKK